MYDPKWAQEQPRSMQSSGRQAEKPSEATAAVAPVDNPLASSSLRPQATDVDASASLLSHWVESASSERSPQSQSDSHHALPGGSFDAGAQPGFWHESFGCNTAFNKETERSEIHGLDPILQSRFSKSLGEDLADVKVERGLSSRDQALGVRAVAEDNRVSVDPATLDRQHEPESQRLLAEEMAHIAQKRRGREQPDHLDALSTAGEVAPADGQRERVPLEHEAKAAARRAVAGEPAPIAAGARVPKRQFGFMDFVHGALDVVGMIPGVGEIADGLNAVIYTAEGDYTNAALSAAAMIPGVGNAATASKWARRGLGVANQVVKHGDEAADISRQVLKHGDEAIDGATGIAKHGDEAVEGTTAVGKKGDDAVDATKSAEPEVPRYETPYKTLGRKKKKELGGKVDDRTITRDEYKQLKWNERFKKRRQRGVQEFWDQEKARLERNETGTRNWSDEQRKAILNGKKPVHNGKTVEGHHMHSAKEHPQLANDPKNIYPATRTEHQHRWHGGNWRNGTYGKPRNPKRPEEF